MFRVIKSTTFAKNLSAIVDPVEFDPIAIVPYPKNNRMAEAPTNDSRAIIRRRRRLGRFGSAPSSVRTTWF